MAEKKKPSRSHARKASTSKSPKQLAVIAILVVVLLVAIATQPRTDDATSTSTSGIQSTQLVSTGGLAIVAQPLELKLGSESAPAESAPHPLVVQVRPMPSIPLDEWIDHDPFATAQIDTLDQAISDVDGVLQIRAIYGQGKSRVALVGRRLIRVGEVLPDGRRVVDITAEGVELAR